MLTDYWVIAQLLAQACALFLMFGAARVAWQMLRKWQPESATATQLQLERQSYLVDTIVRVVLSFQVLSLVLFLFTINNHFPELIEGAMCGTGTLSLNAHGYPTLYLKVGAVFLYLLFLFVHHLDSREPNYPLTPFKYIFIFPSLLLILADGVEMWRYFAGIEPEVIATCCSVSVLLNPTDTTSFLTTGEYTGYAVTLFINLFFVLFALLVFSKKRRILLFLLSLFYVGTAIYSLKFFFVKYIYGLPSHNCLFDLFFGQYHFIGFVLFGSYFGLLGSTLFMAAIHFFKPLLTQPTDKLMFRLRWWGLAFLLLSFTIPIIYRALWDGVL